MEASMILEFFNELKTNNLVRTQQDELSATEYNIIRTPKDSELDPSKPLLNLYDFIRSCDSEAYPAFFYIENEKINIKLWRSNNTNNETI